MVLFFCILYLCYRGGNNMAKIRRDAIDYNLVDWSKSISENAKIMKCSYTSLLNYAKKNGIAFIPGDATRKKPDWSAVEADFRSGMRILDVYYKYRKQGTGICERVLFKRAAKWDPDLLKKQGFDPARYK